ncbi:MAG: anti-sigma factor, partial [Bacteroidetes bacterium]|nr:anti-sigma factor [Bacteroidota bacterium]
MNIKDYIESGILEAYVLQTLTPEENAEVEANILLYPELADEIANIEIAMQQFAEANAQEPPAFMQEQIWSAIKGDTAVPKTDNKLESPAAKTIPLNTAAARPATWQWAAAVIFLLASLAGNIILLNQRNALKEQQLALQKNIDTIQQRQTVLAQKMEQSKKVSDMMADPSTQTVVMRSMQKGHPMVATVYWSKEKGEAFVAIQKLPPPPKGMQYQMWVLQGGKPIDLGVLPDNMVETADMEKLPKQVMDGEAFAISLEKEGGSPTPTMENIYV